MTKSTDSAIRWLLDSDPSIRWQVMHDLTGEPTDVVAAERARVAYEGWGARILDLQAPDGDWGVGPYDGRGWTSTTDALFLLRNLGLDPASERARRAIALVREKSTWGPDFGDAPFFEGEEEPCINGRVLAAGAYFGEPSDRLVDRLLGEQLGDGGWNCEAPQSRRSSFHSTICVLEGLLEYEKAKGATTEVTEARERAQEYLLERRMFRSASTGEVVDPDWTEFAAPTYWQYDVLWGLDHLQCAGIEPDQRAGEAIDMVKSKRQSDGRWLLDNRYAGRALVEMGEDIGKPSRWITLRALRVLGWYTAGD